MIVAAHADTEFHNEYKSRSCTGDHIFMAEDEPQPKWNVPVLTLSQTIKFVMTSATEAAMGALFITPKEMVPISQTLIEMGWSQPLSPIQTEKSTAAGVMNKTIVPCKSKSWDLRY